MITSIIILVIGEALYRFCDAEMDTIKFRPQDSWYPKWGWYVSTEWHFPFWLKVPFSMLQNGWHFIKFLMQMARIGAIVLVVCLTYSVEWYYGIGLLIALYAFGGIIWEITYS